MRSNSLSEYNIFSKVNEFELFKYYFHPNFYLGVRYNSPYRIDKNPSFNIFRAREGTNQFLWKDWGDGETGNIFKLIMKIVKYRNGIELNYYQAMCKVNQDFEMGLDENDLEIVDLDSKFIFYKSEDVPIITEQAVEYEIRKIITPKCIKWTKDYFNCYWNRFEYLRIEKLEEFNVYPAKRVYLDENLLWEWLNYNPIYSYSEINNEWGEILFKIYRPLERNKRFKFLNSFTSKMIEGLEQLPDKVDLLILTKSRKDVIILNLLGYYAVTLPSETAKFTDHHYTILNSISSENLLLYDNDNAGIKASNKINELYGYKQMFFPVNIGKDVSAIYEKYKYSFTKRLIDNMIDEVTRY